MTPEIELELMTADPIELEVASDQEDLTLEAQAFVKGSGDGSLTEEIKQALLQMAEHVAYIDEHGQDYYQDLYDALYPPRALTYISVVYDPGTAVIYESTSLESLKQYLVVTAHYDDKTTEIIASEDYTLSGTLTVGTSVITAEYRSKTKSFSVEVAETPTLSSITAEYAQGSAVIYDTDSLDTLKQYLVVTANYSDGTSEAVTDYALSGTLTEGTSTITVSYGGKTTTFDVVVSIGLDSIAYGSMTYRDIFITNNLFFMSDFEGEISLTNTNIPYEGDSKKTYRINAGSPSITQEAYNSASHSLKAFGSGSSQIVASRAGVNMVAGQYLTCVAVNCLRYSAGKLGIQWGAPVTGTVDRLTVAKESTTNGFEAVAGIMAITAKRADFYAYVGSMSSANLDGYVDDVIITPLPSGMTLEQGLTLYENYLAIRRNA